MSMQKQKTILLVEDIDATAMLVTNHLHRFGYQVIIAHTGEEAVELLAGDIPSDLILMDILLGSGIDGAEAAKQILAHRKIPIVFLASDLDADTMEKVRGITRYGYVLKNSNTYILQSSIEMAFELFERQNQLKNELIERHRIEAALVESERIYRSQFLSNSSVMLFVNPVDGAIIDANVAASSYYGYTREQLVAMHISDIATPPSPDLREEMNSVSAGIGKQSQFQHRLADGSLRDVEVSTSKVQFSERTVLHSIVYDITERKLAEVLLQKSESRLSDIIFSMADWVWEVDAHGVYTYSSQKSVDILGRPVDEIIGKTPFDFMPPEEVERIAPIFKDTVAKKANIVNLENWIIKKSGESICLLTTGETIIDEGGCLRG